MLALERDDIYNISMQKLDPVKEGKLDWKKILSHKERNCWLVRAGLLVALLLNEKFEALL